MVKMSKGILCSLVLSTLVPVHANEVATITLENLGKYTPLRVTEHLGVVKVTTYDRCAKAYTWEGVELADYCLYYSQLNRGDLKANSFALSSTDYYVNKVWVNEGGMLTGHEVTELLNGERLRAVDYTPWYGLAVAIEKSGGGADVVYKPTLYHSDWQRFDVLGSSVNDVALTADGFYYASNGWGHRYIYKYNTATNTSSPLPSLPGGSASEMYLAIDLSGTGDLAVANAKNGAYFFRDGQLVSVPKPSPSAIARDIQWASDGTLIVLYGGGRLGELPKVVKYRY